jgi:hypothetical protein
MMHQNGSTLGAHVKEVIDQMPSIALSESTNSRCQKGLCSRSYLPAVELYGKVEEGARCGLRTRQEPRF